MLRKNRSHFLSIVLMLLCGSMVMGSTLSRKRNLNNLTALQQPADSVFLTFNEYMGYVKAYHPVAKQAGLFIDEGQAEVLRARGGFDPKLEVDYDRKEFKSQEYYDELNGMFKIPTWYGVEFKAGIERNEGDFLDPSSNVPTDGLYSAGVSVNLGQGLVINERMATLRKAKIFREQSAVDRDLLVNEILFEAALAYFQWWEAQQQYQIFDEFLENAEIRFQAIKRGAEVGDKAIIDTVEASIAVQNRMLSREQARIGLVKERLNISNFLWINDVPVELQPNVYAQNEVNGEIDSTLEIFGFQLNEFNIENHPKLRSLGFKIDQLDVDRQLKENKLLPKLTLDYNFLTPEWNNTNSLRTNDYKAGLRFAFPLFLRKERGDIKLAKIKIADMEYERAATQLEIRNKVTAIFNEIDSYNQQTRMIGGIVDASERMLTAEERKFELGDSSLFLINSREVKLIDSKLKEIKIYNKLFVSKANLFKSLAVMPENL